MSASFAAGGIIKSELSLPTTTTDPPPLAAVMDKLSQPDSILEPRVYDSFDAFLAEGGQPTKLIRLLSDSYKGRPDMIHLLSNWLEFSGLGANEVQDSIWGEIERILLKRFDGTVADAALLVMKSQPPWMEHMVSQPAMVGLFEKLMEKAPASLFVQLCVRMLQEQQQLQQSDIGGRGAAGKGGDASSKKATVSTILTSLIRSTCLTDFNFYQALLTSILHQIIVKNLEKAFSAPGASVSKDRSTSVLASAQAASSKALAKLSNADLASKIESMDLDALLHDFVRLASQSEQSYLVAQHLLQSVRQTVTFSGSNHGEGLRILFHRLEQDLRQYATFPPVTSASLLLKGAASGLATDGGATSSSSAATTHIGATALFPAFNPSGGSSESISESTKNPHVFPVDIFLLGLKEEYYDCYLVLNVLYRTQTLLLPDILKLYNKYASPISSAATGASGAKPQPPPVSIIRDQLFIRTLLNAVFGKVGTSSSSTLAASTPSLDIQPVRTDRDKYIYLLAYACCVKDERLCNVRLRKLPSSASEDAIDAAIKSEGASSTTVTVDKASLESTRIALQRLHDLIHHKQWASKPAAILRLIQSNLKTPLFATATLLWIGNLLMDTDYYDTTYHSVLTPYFLNILGSITLLHPLLRGEVFHILQVMFHLNIHSMDPLSSISFKKQIISLLLHLLHTGYNLHDLIRLVSNEIPRGLDQSLLRHFLSQLFHSIAPPYSRGFLEEILTILAMPQTKKAMQESILNYMKNYRKECEKLLSEKGSVITASDLLDEATREKARIILAEAHVVDGTTAARRLLAFHGIQLPEEPVKKEGGDDEDTKMKDEEQETDSERPNKKQKNSANSSSSILTLRVKERDLDTEMEKRRQSESLLRMKSAMKREPRPLSAVGSHDTSDSALLDFCTLLHASPDLLRFAPIVRNGFQTSDEDYIVSDEGCVDSASQPSPNPPPMEENRFDQHMQTIQSYLNLTRNIK